MNDKIRQVNLLLAEKKARLQSQHYLICSRGTTLIGIPLYHVMQVLEIDEFHPAFQSPICSMMAWNNSVLPIVDFRSQKDPSCTGQVFPVVVVMLEQACVGLVVDGVGDIRVYGHDQICQIKNLPPHSSWVKGLVKENEKQIMLIEIEKVLTPS